MQDVLDILWHRLLRRPYILAATDTGNGEPIVLLHGLGASQHAWAPLTKRLQQNKWRVISLDLLGFGDSPRPEWSNYTVDDHARAVVATLKRLRVRMPVVLIGHSMGCLVAARIAAKWPRYAKQLVLFVPPLFANLPEYPSHIKWRTVYFRFFRFVMQHPGIALLQSRWLWRIMRRLSGMHLSKERWIPFERSLRNTIMEQRIYQDLQSITVPTDLIQGRLDFVVIRAEVDKMFHAHPNITMHVLTKSHLLTQKSAAYIAGLLEGRPAKVPSNPLKVE